MEDGFMYWHWFILAVVLGTIEMLAPGIFFLWLALAAFLTGVFALIVMDASSAMQISVFAGLSILMVVAAWKFFKRNPITSDQPLLNLRAAQYVGKTYGLETAIAHGSGRIRIGDTTWKVEGSDMAAGTTVRVVGFEGAVLKVEKVGEAPVSAAPAATVAGDDLSEISTTAGHKVTDPLKDSLEDPLTRKA